MIFYRVGNDFQNYPRRQNLPKVNNDAWMWSEIYHCHWRRLNIFHLLFRGDFQQENRSCFVVLLFTKRRQKYLQLHKEDFTFYTRCRLRWALFFRLFFRTWLAFQKKKKKIVGYFRSFKNKYFPVQPKRLSNEFCYYLTLYRKNLLPIALYQLLHPFDPLY